MTLPEQDNNRKLLKVELPKVKAEGDKTVTIEMLLFSKQIMGLLIDLPHRAGREPQLR